MKIDKLKKTIKYNIIIFTLLVILISFLVFLYYYLNNSYLNQYDKIIMDIAQIKNEANEIDRKTTENKKYMDLWSKINENRKSMAGIKVDDINKTLSNLAEKYSVSSPVLKVSVPESYPSSIFKNENVTLIYSILEVNFTSFNDVKAIQFANDFITTLHGYPILTKFEFSKERDYEVADYYDISSGKLLGLIKGRIIVSWYTYKESMASNNAPKK
jgi:hypothetical protein